MPQNITEMRSLKNEIKIHVTDIVTLQQWIKLTISSGDMPLSKLHLGNTTLEYYRTILRPRSN